MRRGAGDQRDDSGQSGGVTDDLQFGGSIYRGEEVVYLGHGDAFQFCFAALTALKGGEGADDHDGGVTDFERQVGYACFHRALADSAGHFANFRERLIGAIGSAGIGALSKSRV